MVHDGELRNNGQGADVAEQYAYGRNSVYEILLSGKRKIKEVYLASDGKGEIREKIIGLCKDKHIPIKIVTQQILNKINQGASHQGIAALVADIETYGIEQVLESINSKKEKPFFLILNQIYDPHNIGALMRSADACGVHGVIISSHHSSPINSTVVKTSAGASEYVPIIRENNLAQTIDKLKKLGIWIFGADMEGNVNYFNTDLDIPLALVLGNEGEGLQELVRKKCDFLINIPMKGKINSLNVSVAGALLMFEVYRKRRFL